MEGNRFQAFARRWPAAHLSLDSLAYLALVYCACSASLLFYEGLYSWRQALCRTSIVLVFVLLLELGMLKAGHASSRILKWSPGKVTLAWILIFPLLFLVAPYLIAGITPRKAYSNEWMPLDFVKFRYNFVLLFRTAPWDMAAFSLLPFLVILLRYSLGRKRLSLVLMSAFTLAMFYILEYSFYTEEGGGQRDLGHLWRPLLIPLAAFALDLRKLGCRSLVATWLLAPVWFLYVGFLPLGHARELNPLCPAFLRADVEAGKPEGVTKLYPRGADDSRVLLSFLREMVVDEAGRRLYVGFGPTSGVFEVNMDTGEMESIVSIHGVMRALKARTGTGTLLGLDFLDASLFEFRLNPLDVLRITDLFAPTRLPTPIDFEMDEDLGRIFVVNYEGCALTEMDLSTFRKLRDIRFHDQGLLEFRNGGQCLTYDRARRKLYVLIGFVDLGLGWRLVRVDAERMEVEGVVDLPYGGMRIEYFPETSSVFTTSFWTDDIFEVGTDPFAVKRRIAGTLSCRNLAYDERRRLVYATSYSRGDLLFIDYDSGRVLATLHLGPKVSSLFFHQPSDTLYLGCGSGIWKVDLGRFPATRSRGSQGRLNPDFVSWARAGEKIALPAAEVGRVGAEFPLASPPAADPGR